MRSLLVLSLLGFGCSKAAVPATIETFVPSVGEQVPAGCTKDADGKRFAMTGHLALSSSMTIDKGKVPLTLCADVDDEGDCRGRGAQVLVTTPGDIDDLWSAASGVKTAGYKTRQGKVGSDALRIHAKNGDATAKDVLDVVVEVSTVLQFQTKAVTACELSLVSAMKK